MLLHTADLPSNRSTWCPPVEDGIRRVCESVGRFHPRDRQTSLSTDAAWITAGCPPGLFPSVLTGSVGMTCWIVLSLLHAQELEGRFAETDPAPRVNVPKAGVNAADVERQQRTQASVWLRWNL